MTYRPYAYQLNSPDGDDDDLPLPMPPDEDDLHPLPIPISMPMTHGSVKARTEASMPSWTQVPPIDFPPHAGHNGSAARAGAAADAMSADPNAESMHDTLRWALDSLQSPSLAAADWLARDIDPNYSSAVAMLTDPAITLAQIKQAKSVFKTMRIVGEKAADRRVGARMYAAAIAAGLVRFRTKISTQSDAALKRGFQGLLDDRSMPMPLRDLAGSALCVLKELQDSQSRNMENRSRSA